MATKFVKGQEVRVNTTPPQGPVQGFRVDEDGNMFYLVEWTDSNGAAQTRWFPEDALVAV